MSIDKDLQVFNFLKILFLVRDIFSGIFFLIDDGFRIGDSIETGSLKGMVENISIRSLKLLSPRGMVSSIPFGELKSVTNFTRDWIVMKLDFRVPYNTNIDKVRKIVKKINKELEEEHELGTKLLDPVKC
jgi:small-conductance mechanosensitive channel